MACGSCKQIRSDLARAVRRGDAKGAVESVRNGIETMAEKLKRPAPKTARHSARRGSR